MTTQNTTTLPTAPGGGPLDPLGADLNKTLRTLKLGERSEGARGVSGLALGSRSVP